MEYRDILTRRLCYIRRVNNWGYIEMSNAHHFTERITLPVNTLNMEVGGL